MRTARPVRAIRRLIGLALPAAWLVAAAASAGAAPRTIVAFDRLPADAIPRLQRAGVTHAALFGAADAAAVVASPRVRRRIARWRDVVAVYPERRFDLLSFQAKESTGVAQVLAGAPPLTAAYTGEGVTVAVLDTGIEATHPDLAGRVPVHLNFEPAGLLDPITDGSYSSQQARTPVGVDEFQHGTLVAGIVAGGGEAGQGADMRGAAPAATLVNVKLIGQVTHELPDDAIGEANALAAYQWLLDHRNDPEFPGGIRVATNSWGFTQEGFEPVALTRMLQSVVDAGIVVVFAAGNEGPGEETVAYPGRLPWLITVGATCKTQGVWTDLCDLGPGQVANFSSRGPQVDVMAPGVDMWGPLARGGYELTLSMALGAARPDPLPPAPGAGAPSDELSNRLWYGYGPGTSFATPHVAGIVAAMLQANPALRQAEVEAILQRTASDIGVPGFDADTGHGLVNAHAAVAAAELAARPPAATAAPDREPPALAVTGRRTQRPVGRRAVAVSVACQEACRVRAGGRLRVSGSARTQRLRPASADLLPGARRRLVLELPRAAAAALRRAFARRRRARVDVVVTAVDAAGNATRRRLAIRLRRR